MKLELDNETKSFIADVVRDEVGKMTAPSLRCQKCRDIRMGDNVTLYGLYHAVLCNHHANEYDIHLRKIEEFYDAKLARLRLEQATRNGRGDLDELVRDLAEKEIILHRAIAAWISEKG